MKHIEPYKLTKIKQCEWCGCFFTPKHMNQKYCNASDKPCSKEAHKEAKRNYWQRRSRTNPPTPKLGEAGLNEHADPDFDKELRKVRNEKYRILGRKR